MSKIDSLIMLINSLTKSEKKKFNINSKDSDYYYLFNLIDNNKDLSSTKLRSLYTKKRPNGKFEVAVSYLYKVLLNNLLSLREEQDNHYFLFNKILKARVLFEKSLFEEAMNMLEQAKYIAQKQENHYAYLYAVRLELNYLLYLNFPDITEKKLLGLHLKLKDCLKIIRKINEQSELYELLKHRITYGGNVRSQQHKESFNDLLVSEMSITASTNIDSFEISKQHLLFQSSYLISIGDYRSAIHTYYELTNLFDNNKHLLANPPIYYINALEGILDNLRSIRKYEEMNYFINELKKLNHPFVNFQINVASLIFLYELFPYLDCGEFDTAYKIMKIHKENVLDKAQILNPSRQAEINLYIALIYIGLKKFKEAKNYLLQVITRGKTFYTLPLYRTIRLVNLIIHYETNDTAILDFETRSIKREISKVKKAYKVEHLMLNFLNKPKVCTLEKNRENEWQKIESEISDFRNDIFEKQLLKYFDFTAWIESKIRHIPLNETLKAQVYPHT